MHFENAEDASGPDAGGAQEAESANQEASFVVAIPDFEERNEHQDCDRKMQQDEVLVSGDGE